MEKKFEKQAVVAITEGNDLAAIIWTNSSHDKVFYKVEPMDEDEIISLYNDNISS
mgnify:CR=1 FL=1